MAHGVYADDGCGYVVYMCVAWTEVNQSTDRISFFHQSQMQRMIHFNIPQTTLASY